MTQTIPCIAVVPAAGVGQRMGRNIPKQYLSVAGKTILEHSVAGLLGDSRVKHVVIAVGPEDDYFSQLSIASDPRVSRVEGGKNRAESVTNALHFAVNKFPSSIVIVHDAARPCLPRAVLTQLIDAVYATPKQGALVAIKARDTLKRSEDGSVVAQTVDRQYIWQAQTPQGADSELLLAALKSARQNGLDITDEASALEAYGCRPRLVEGSVRNLKVTEPDDLLLADVWLNI